MSITILSKILVKQGKQCTLEDAGQLRAQASTEQVYTCPRQL